MAILHRGSSFPGFPQSRRAAFLLSVVSLVLLIALWKSFAVDTPYHLQKPASPNHSHGHNLPAGDHHRPGADAGSEAAELAVADDDDESIASLTNFTLPDGASAPPHRKLGGADDPLCAHHPNTSNIAVVMKTGATESYARLPTQFLTVLRCLDDFLVFSDKAQTIAGVRVLDALDDVLPEAQRGNADFDLYRDQAACAVDQGPCTSAHDRAQAGWDLDKYKNIHMAEKAWREMPGRDWYLFVDADTYVLWNSLAAWLAGLDPDRKLYLGSVAYINDFPFSHGGSGYILSRAAMEAFVGANPGVANEYDVRTKNTCCGDYMFAQAAKDVAGIEVTQAWPTINGEKPFTLPYGSTNWCQPIVTMHHLSTEEISDVWEWETKYYASLSSSASPTSSSSPSSPSSRPAPQPVRIRQFYDTFVSDRLVPRRDAWDNLSKDRFFLDFASAAASGPARGSAKRAVKEENKKGLQKEAHLSFDHCRRACVEDWRCFQFSYHPAHGVCGFGFSTRLGAPVPTDPGLLSGWDLEYFGRWLEAHDHCGEVEWPKV